MKEWITIVHRGVVGFALTSSGLSALGIGTWWLYKGETSSALAGLGAGLALLFAATIDRFEFLKVLGMEAKTRFDQKINEAERMLKHIQELAASTGGSLIELHTTAAEGSPQERIAKTYDKVQNAKSLMLKTGSDETAIRDAATPWLIATAHALWGHFAEPIHHEVRRLEGALKIEQLKYPNNSETYAARLQSIRSFLHADTRPMRLSNVSDYLRRLELMRAPPEVDPMYRAKLQPHINKAIEELTHLNEKLEFKDRAFWFSLPSL
jgi:hypothetical protein